MLTYYSIRLVNYFGVRFRCGVCLGLRCLRMYAVVRAITVVVMCTFLFVNAAYTYLFRTISKTIVVVCTFLFVNETYTYLQSVFLELSQK